MLAGLHGRARQNDAVHLAVDETFHRFGDGKVGFAGSRRAETKHQIIRGDGTHILRLYGRTRLDNALARVHSDVAGLQIVAGAAGNHTDGAVDFGGGDRTALLQPLVKAGQHGRRGFGLFRGTGDGHLVAAGVQRHIEPLFYLRQMAVVAAEQKRQEAVVIELEKQGSGVPHGHRLVQALILFFVSPTASLSPESTPLRLLVPASAIVTRMTRPRTLSGAIACTDCI